LLFYEFFKTFIIQHMMFTNVIRQQNPIWRSLKKEW